MRFYPPKTTTIDRENSTLNKCEIVLDWDNNNITTISASKTIQIVTWLDDY